MFVCKENVEFIGNDVVGMFGKIIVGEIMVLWLLFGMCFCRFLLVRFFNIV